MLFATRSIILFYNDYTILTEVFNIKQFNNKPYRN